MRRKITEAHLLLIITSFAMYMGYQWLMQWIPLHDVGFCVSLMGQVMPDDFLGHYGCWIRYRKNEDRNCRKECFLHRYSMPTSRMAVSVIISAYPVG